MVHRFKNTTFSHSVFQLVPLDDLVFFEDLERVVFPDVLFLHEQHFAIGALADHGNCLKRLCSNFASNLLLLGNDLLVLINF